MKYEATMTIVMRSDDKTFIERSIADTQADAEDIRTRAANFTIDVTATEITETDAPVHTNLSEETSILSTKDE